MLTYKYLYIFNFPPEQEDLCKLEFKYLFKDTFVDKYYFSNIDVHEDTSIFIKAKIDIFVMGKIYQPVLEDLRKKTLFYLDFKVIYLKNETEHVEYKESLQWCKDVSWPIDGSVNMAHPKHTIAITKIHGTWIVGYYHHGVPSWKKHNDKPHTFSNSLDIRIARTVINIATQNDDKVTVVDPCCGVGTVVLEGLALHKKIEGFDISREISYQARLNLLHYGYDPYLINRVSIHDLDKHYDVAIMDIPYNLYTPITPQEQFSLIVSARKICDRLIIITYEDMRKELNQAHFLILDECIIKKSNYCDFQRRIYVCI